MQLQEVEIVARNAGFRKGSVQSKILHYCFYKPMSDIEIARGLDLSFAYVKRVIHQLVWHGLLASPDNNKFTSRKW